MNRALLIATLSLAPLTAQAAFVSVSKTAFTATAVMAGNPTLTINALPLSNRVESGKHFVIPVEVKNTAGGPIDTTGLRVDVVYQMVDSGGVELGSPAIVPITFQRDPRDVSRLTGSGYIPRAELSAIGSGGRLKYFFRVLQGSEGVYTGSGAGGGNAGVKPYPSGSAAAALSLALADAYSATVEDTYEFPVGPQGNVIALSDTFQTDGETSVRFEPGALSSAGTLRIQQLQPGQLPSGPRGARAIVAYDISLLNASLLQPAQVVLSYPADLNGRISDSSENPATLAPYWWDGYSWRLLSRPRVDTTLHTVTGVIPHQTHAQPLSGSFALFPMAAGSVAASQRPAERIITPNGDGINDEAGFSGLSGSDDVRILDVRGRRVRTLTSANTCRSLLASVCWDGRDDSGDTVESGIYIYQFTSQDERVSGVIAVAK